MANNKYEEIVQLTTDDIIEQLEDSKAKLGKMRFNHAVSPVEDSTELKKLRKRIARLMTELRKRQLEESK
jgi:large subunit ribosomal protein L29